jgi:PAS domain S-box-containing protein
VPDNNNSTRDTSLRYLIATVSAALGIGIRVALAGLLGPTAPYITLFPAVVFAAWFGGLWPGITAMAIGLVGAFAFIAPFDSHSPTAAADAMRAVVFVSGSVILCVLIDIIKQAQKRDAARVRELTVSRDLLQVTLASIGDAVITTDSAGKVTFLNAVASSLTNWSQTQAQGKPVREVFPIRNEKTGKAIPGPVEKVLAEGVVVALANHTVLVNKEGEEIPVEDSAAPIRDDQKQVHGAVLVFRDVSARRKADERLGMALEVGRIGIWDWDILRNQIEWSDQIYEIFGMERAAFGGSFADFDQLVHPEDRKGIEAAVRAALEESAPYQPQFRRIHPQKGILWMVATGQVFRNDKGEPVRMLGSVSDITKRKQSEERLLQQWRTFDIALSHTPDFTYVFDLEGRFTYVNRALLSLWQKPLEEAVGKNFFDLGYPAELAARLQRQIQQVIDTKEQVRDQTPFTGPTGETGYYEYIFVPIIAAAGQVESVAGSTRDVTERTKAEENLRRSEERLTLALEAGGGVGTWDWDVVNDRVYSNARYAQLFSLDPQTGIDGAPVAKFLAHIHPEDRGRVEQRAREAVSGGAQYADEYRVIEADGSARWIQVRGRSHLDAAGKPTRFPGVAFDITDRKRAEEALRESQERIRAIYDAIYEYIGLLSVDGKILDCNPASLTFAGNTLADVVGRPFWESPWFTATPGMPERVKSAVTEVAAGASVRIEMTLIRPSGEARIFDFSMHPIRNQRGEVVLMVPEARDITDLKRAEEELSRANEELRRANRELEEFAYVASHDLQEPLRMVNIYTELILQEAANAEEAAEYAGFVRQGVRRMEGLIQGLLTFSRAVHADGPSVNANLADSLNEALSVLNNRIEENGSVITAETMPVVRGDTAQFAHVFQNLLSNSMKYRKKGTTPEIHVSAVEDGEYWTISVRDNGMGFDPQYAERIFGLFKRLYKEEYPGTGLGLAICKRIVERYGGRIWAEGRPGEGATFSFSLHRAD